MHMSHHEPERRPYVAAAPAAPPAPVSPPAQRPKPVEHVVIIDGSWLPVIVMACAVVACVVGAVAVRLAH